MIADVLRFDTWGWTSWRDRLDVDMLNWSDARDSGWLKSFLVSLTEAKYCIRVFQSLYMGEITTDWDFLRGQKRSSGALSQDFCARSNPLFILSPRI